MPESTNDKLSRLAATGVLGAGVGYAAYKGIMQSQGALRRLGDAVSSTSRKTPDLMVYSPREIQEKILAETFEAGEDIMSQGGWKNMLTKAYSRALYKTGIVKDDVRPFIIDELVAMGSSWDDALRGLEKYKYELGGAEGLYQALREITGATAVSKRGMSLPDVIRDFSSNTGGEIYTRAAFQQGGSFWRDRFGIDPDPLSYTRTKPTGHSFYRKDILERGFGSVSLGVRDSERKRKFRKEKAFRIEREIPGTATRISLPFSEFRVGSPEDKLFLQVPEAVSSKNYNLVATDHRGMGFAAVPHFAVPVGDGTRYRKVSWNEGMDILLQGDKSVGIKGLVGKLHDLHGNRKARARLARKWNTVVRGLFHRINGSSSDMTQALMHSKSIVPLERIMKEIIDEADPSNMEDLIDIYRKMKTSGISVSPLHSPDPMAKHYRFSLEDWGKRWDIFGEDYPIERRYGSRVKPFSMTSAAEQAMEQMPIAGILPRGYGITATEAARGEMHRLPQAVGYLSLDSARHLSPEEALLSPSMAPMMEMKQIQKFEFQTGTLQGQIGEVIEGGTAIGVDYRTGQTIYSKSRPGAVEQRILNAQRSSDGITRVEIETTLPMQDQTKLFGYKVQVHQARGSIESELIHEFQVSKADAAFRYSKNLEFLGSSKLLKDIPNEINKQMSEALWLTTQRRLSEAGVLGAPGKAKILRQQRRAKQGLKTYSYKGGTPKENVSMGMWLYVNDEKSRARLLRNKQIKGMNLATKLGLSEDKKALGAGIEILKQAKKWHMDPKDIGLIGGAYYRSLASAVGDDEAFSMLRNAGLSESDIKSLKEAKGVLVMPTMNVGGYASFSDKWGRAGMDYRALSEIKAQQWGEAGELIIEEMARRVIPSGDLKELEMAALSIGSRGAELPSGIEEITSVRKAEEALGKRPFIFSFQGEKMYVPSGETKGMGNFIYEIGAEGKQELSKSYSRFFSAARNVLGETHRGDELFENAKQNLVEQVHKHWAAATSLRGKVIGTAGPVARRWIPKSMTDILAHQYADISEFISDAERPFKLGITRETGEKMFRDLMDKATEGEKAYLSTQRKLFLEGNKISGVVWRHPTHRPQSMMPVWFQLAEGKGESVMFPKLEMKMGDRVMDVSLAHGMKLDFDFDHVQLAVIGDEKTKLAVDKLLNSSRWKEQFVKGIETQYALEEQIKKAAISGRIDPGTERYIKGLQKLVGVKMETGAISNLVGEMRAAAAFEASQKDFTTASYLLAELEEGPISSKHGLHVGEVKKHLQDFVRGGGGNVRNAMREAWDKLLGEGVFKAGDIQYSREEFIDQMSNWIAASEDNKNLASFRAIARRGAQAQKGAIVEEITSEELYKVVKDFAGGRGDLNADLIRRLRVGEAAAASVTKKAFRSLGELGSAAMSGIKKHWKVPAIAAAAALGISALSSSTDLDMSGASDPNQRATELGQGQSIPNIPPPSSIQNRIVTAGGASMPAGYGMTSREDYSSRGTRELARFGQQIGASVMMQDNRGAITPEYIEKAQRERYY